MPQSESLKQAEADVAAAKAAAKRCEDTLNGVIADIEKATSELARLSALGEPTQKDLHAEELLRRKKRRLEVELLPARELVEAAEVSVKAAERRYSEARLADIDMELTGMDAEFVGDVKASAKRLSEQRAAIFALLREAHDLEFSLRPGAAWSHRSALAAVPSESLAPLEAAQETVERVAAIERQRAQMNPEG
jgi:hypothetical protein